MNSPSRATELLRAVKTILGNLQSEAAPKKLVSRINAELEDHDLAETTVDEIFGVVFGHGSKSLPDLVRAVQIQMQINATKWAKAADPTWSTADAQTVDRYIDAISALGFSAEQAAQIEVQIPYVTNAVVIIDDGTRSKWYTDEIRNRNSFYWSAYQDLLISRPTFSQDSIVRLDQETSAIVEQLEDPTENTFSSRGLVVGHVQSGKTSNFAGVIAKAIDAGYRLIVVLSGNTESLRSQTQRRLDMEIVGIANILGDRTKETNPGFYNDLDYVISGNPKFPDGFIKHDLSAIQTGLAPFILRLTDSRSDFTQLHKMAVLNAFDYGAEVINPDAPIYSWENLQRMRVRFLVVKKEKNNLQRVLRELYENRSPHQREMLKYLPTLIIDDESDQASINTRPPTDKEEIERTKINELIVKVLGNLKRAQYVGYTATPFANVLVNADDPMDLFPQHFIMPLGKSDGYMGAKEFHDLEVLDGDDADDYATSNRRAFVREWENTDPDGHGANAIDERSMIHALDSFVLTGAIKLWRKAHGWNIDVRHHTMLVHFSQKKLDAQQVTQAINEDLWSDLAHSEVDGLERLRELYDQDFIPVATARKSALLNSQGEAAPELASQPSLPVDFDELSSFIDMARTLITSGGYVAMEVNSNSNDVNFDTTDTWKVLVGGNLLSRGFTVEGLTVSYFTRPAKTQDTLMQMGRWFGYRTGYSDLVRLFLPDRVLWKKATRKRSAQYVNLCDLFTESAAEEEDFRDQLKLYSETSDVDGFARITPARVPPLVIQAAPELLPAAKNKMWNAVLDHAGRGGIAHDLHFVGDTAAANAKNFKLAKEFLEQRGATQTLVSLRNNNVVSFPAHSEWLLDVSNDQVLNLLEKFEFHKNHRVETDIATIQKAIADGGLESWKVLIQDPQGRKPHTVDGLSINLLKAKRVKGKYGRSSQVVHTILEQISGRKSQLTAEEVEKHGGTNPFPTKCGALSLTFAFDEVHGDGLLDGGSTDLPPTAVSTLICYALPYEWAPQGRIGWRARNKNSKAVVVPNTQGV
jgi:hypothetical protein